MMGAPVDNFYPRSPCGERPASVQTRLVSMSFLSTLSLRRATIFTACQATVRVFLSTLSLRRATAPQPSGQYDGLISIHALLAESDGAGLSSCFGRIIFLSTLSLRRATSSSLNTQQRHLAFLSTLSLRRATALQNTHYFPALFLSTLSLRRATV